MESGASMRLTVLSVKPQMHPAWPYNPFVPALVTLGPRSRMLGDKVTTYG